MTAAIRTESVLVGVLVQTGSADLGFYGSCVIKDLLKPESAYPASHPFAGPNFSQKTQRTRNGLNPVRTEDIYRRAPASNS